MEETLVSFPGYWVGKQIYNGSRTVVYRGQREADREPVVIKFIKNAYPSFAELVQFRNQYTIAKNLDFSGIVRPYSLEKYQNGFALVMEDFGGISLKEYADSFPSRRMGDDPDSLKEFFQIAIAIVSALDVLYRHCVIHKDVKPANILINPTTKQVKLIDFSLASLLPRETQTLTSPNVLEGTLAYLSPEQTGRMNRGIDYRSDFYSLGVTFYELLSGTLPFPSDDPMELIHCHIAKQPASLHSLNPAIPPILSEIVSNLMAKNAENRYQSTLGLKHDLETCFYQWKETGKIESFKLRQRDISDRFVIPEKLYGREEEVASLLAAFERVSQGTTETILVAGFSGIGKTAVVNEVHKPIVRQRGYFIKGKFDQFQRNIPLFALVQSLRDLMGQLLTETDDKIEEWKNQILSVLGEQGQVILEVIPELEKIIGKQPPVTELSGSAAQNRFNLLFLRFIQVFATKEHPLVIFLDDLQWADLASLKLIEVLMSEAGSGYLLLIGAYRDNEVSTEHPLMLTLEEIRKAKASVNSITLAPLALGDLNYLIAETLSCSFELASPLTQLVYQKTKGNPFFACQLLKALYEDGLISFNFDVGYWQCDIARVKSLYVTEDVVEFIALQLQKLPAATQEVLKLAACIGNSFNLETLAIVSEMSQTETAASLWKALQEGLILPQSEIYKFFQEGHEKTPLQFAIANSHLPKYKFLHDRVQQAAYLLIPENSKKETHLKIGLLLLKNTPEEEREDKIFEIVNQLNYGADLIERQSDRDDLAQLNLVAGRKAKLSTAHAAAVNYLTVGIKLLAIETWQNNYNLTLSLYHEACEVTYLTGDFEGMNRIASTVIERAKTLLDAVPVYAIKIIAYQAQEKFLEALKMGLQVLQSLGLSFPENPTLEDAIQSLTKTTSLFNAKSTEELINLPDMTDPVKLAANRLIGTLYGFCHRVAPLLFPLLGCAQVELTLSHGNSSWSASCYVMYGLSLAGFLDDIDSSYRAGEVSLQLLEKFRDKKFRAAILNTVYAYTMPSKKPLKYCFKPFLEAYQSGLETGDLEYASYAIYHYCSFSYWAGCELSDLAGEMATYASSIARINPPTLNLQKPSYQAVLNLLGRSDNPCILSGEVYDEASDLSGAIEANDKHGASLAYLNKMYLCYLHGEFSQAAENATTAQECVAGMTGTVSRIIFNFYESLSLLAIYSESAPEKREAILKKVAENQKQLATRADFAPMNYLHKYYLVEAELKRVLGESMKAMELYDRAIALANENEYLNEEALAHELAARFYLECGKPKIARVYLTDAYYAYARWGAKSKVEDLQKRYPQLLAPILQQEKIYLNSSQTIGSSGSVSLSTRSAIETVTSSSNSISEALDLATIVKVSQAISGEILIDKLIATLMEVVLQNAGAEKCVLILLKENRWVVEATAKGDGEQVAQILRSLPIEESQEIPLTAINYVKRTLEPLAIDNAMAESTWIADPYLLRQQTKSLLCAPILNKGKLTGILYLENNLTVGAFTRDRIQVATVLCSQAAISIENALLYEGLEKAHRQLEGYSHTLEVKVEARTQELKEKNEQLEQTLQQLKDAQKQIIAQEKLASLGSLTAGIAHEIRNPLNFVNNFAAVSIGLTQEVIDEIENHSKSLEAEIVDYITELLSDLRENVAEIERQGKRAESIVQNMLMHARSGNGQRQLTDLNFLLAEAVQLVDRSKRAKEKSFTISLESNYDSAIGQLEVVPQDLSRAFINILDNACYSVAEKKKEMGEEFTAAIAVTTLMRSDTVEIRIRDNGKGIPDPIREKIFQPFFTTKPTGEGTGLGLSLTREIIVGQHRGQIQVESELGAFTEFILILPKIANGI